MDGHKSSEGEEERLREGEFPTGPNIINEEKMWLKRKSGEGPPPTKFRIATVQVLATIVANVSAIAPGMSLGFSAIALPLMHKEATLDTEQSSWIASAASAATPVGCLLAGALCERIGRRGALLAVNLPCLLGWLLIAFVPSTGSKGGPLGGGAGPMAQLIAGRALTGLATGMASSPAPVMVSELSAPKLRGMLVCWNSVAIALGVLIVYSLGAFLPWRIVAGLSAVFPILSIILLLLVPESPIWLLTKGRVDKAREALMFYRAGHAGVVEAEFSQALETAAMKAQINRRRRSSTISANFQNRSNSFLAAIMRPEVYKPLLIMNGYFLFQQFSGTFVVVFYAVDIVVESGVKGIDPFIATVFIGLVRLFVCIGVSLGMKRFGRRAPSIISGAGMTVCMATLAIYLMVQSKSSAVPDDDPIISAGKISNITVQTPASVEGMPAEAWIPTLALLGYIALGTLGFLTLPWAMMGEVFPTRIRGAASGLTSAVAYLMSFASIKAYPGMSSTMGPHGVFFVFGVFSVLGTIFVTLWLPETQGRSLDEIESDFILGGSLQLCKRRRKIAEKKQLGSSEPPRAGTESSEPGVHGSREMVNVAVEPERNSEEQAHEAMDLRTDVPPVDDLRGKPDV